MSLSDLAQPAKNIARLIFLIVIIAVLVAIFNGTKDFLISRGWIANKIDKKEVFIQGLKFDYKIVEIVDGDTIKIRRLDGKDVEGVERIMKVRLLGIDTPEVVDPRRPVECFGREASQYLKNISLNRVAALEIDPSQSKFDDYGRILAYVYVKDSGVAGKNVRMLNEQMIKDGYAFEYTYSTPYRYKLQFEWLEDVARVNYLGLWSINTCGGLRTPVAPPAN